MGHLIAIFITLALLGGFFLLTRYEARRGMRFFAAERSAFDKHIARIEFLIAHVDFVAFFKEEVNRALHQVSHTVVHLSLQAVRAVERSLTRLVRSLRVRHEEMIAPRESAREFVKTLSNFKENLNAKHPEISDLE